LLQIDNPPAGQEFDDVKRRKKKLETFRRKTPKKMLQEFIHPLILSSTQHLKIEENEKKIKFVFHLVLLG